LKEDEDTAAARKKPKSRNKPSDKGTVEGRREEKKTSLFTLQTSN
jgi:hypothetical protein